MIVRLSTGNDVIPIPGTKSASRLEENVGALNVKLTKEEADEIAEVVAPGAGERYAPTPKSP
jgi:aryl-alcohol dehydrogenase-like predicted oxidoreductase